jgi:hypothetical protein
LYLGDPRLHFLGLLQQIAHTADSFCHQNLLVIAAAPPFENSIAYR